MPRIPDLVQDAEIRTRFHPEYTVHVYTDTGATVRERIIVREEHWKREKLVGAGSYGRVWLERCVRGQRGAELRAVKEVIKSPHTSRRTDYSRELEAIAKFSNPKYERCFVKSFGWYESDIAVFIAMEYLEHGDLQNYLYSAPQLPESDAQQIIYQVLEGLHFMHENGFAHRDLKPGNILVKSQPPDLWWVKLSDFGISKRAVDNLAEPSTTKGTKMYMAPELLDLVESGDGEDSRDPQAADLWALGETAFQMLTKKPTFKSASLLLDYIRQPDTFPSAVLRGRRVSEIAISFISRMMQPKPEDRQNTALALRQPWMEPYSSHTTGETSSMNAEPVVTGAIPVDLMEDSLFVPPSGRWSTVSNGAPQSGSSTNTFDTAAREGNTMDTTITVPETNSSTLNSLTEDTMRPVPSADNARYFILKSDNETDIETSAALGIWSCGRSTNTRLSNAYKSTSGPIFLVFSVNRSRTFCGVAQMKSPWNLSVPTIHWKDDIYVGGFLVEWLSWTPIGFDDVSHLRHKEENGVPLHRGMFVLELCQSTGTEMMRRFGVPGLVPQPTQQPSDASELGNLDVGSMNLATATGTNASNAIESVMDTDSAVLQSNHDVMDTSTSTSIRKRPLEMEMDMDTSEDEKRQRI